jgi:hypothetical protein
MSNTDSFIEEVSEEVRRDKLFATLKRWGWVAALAVIVAVGGAAYNEWRKAQDRQAAQAFGDQLLERVETEFSGDVLDGMVVENPAQAAIAGHFAAAKALAAGDTEAGLTELRDIAGSAEVDPVYRDLANFKAALALPPETDVSERMSAFDAVTGPFRILAQEQKALLMVADGQQDAALELLRTLIQSAEATPGLQRRASEVIVALGADISDSSAQNADETDN